jgi:putative adhesin
MTFLAAPRTLAVNLLARLSLTQSDRHMRKALIALLLLTLTRPALGENREEVFDKAYSMEGIVKISVENVNGHIDASAWAKPYFKIHAVKRAEGGRAEETLRLTEIRVQKKGDEIRVETINPKRRRLFGFLDFGGSNARVDYQLQIPAATEVHFETCNGKLVATGFSGMLTGDAVNGSIELANMGGPASASTVNGSVRLAFRGPLKKTRIETVNGSIDVAFEKTSSVRYDLETVNGRIEGDFDLNVEGKFGPKQARGNYNGGAEMLHCETVNGTIRLTIN